MLFFFRFFFFSFWLFLWSLFYFFFTRLYTSTKAKILFLNSHQRARKVPVTRIIPTNSTLPFAWSKISTKEFQCVYLVIWQSKAKGTTVFHFLRFEILTMRLPKIIDMSVLFLRFVLLVISEPKRPIALIHWVYEVKEATIWKLVFLWREGCPNGPW